MEYSKEYQCLEYAEEASNNIKEFQDEYDVTGNVEYECPQEDIQNGVERTHNGVNMPDDDLHKDEEMAEELLGEMNLAKLKYQDAESVVQCESKQIIVTQELERTTLLILDVQKKEILKQINDQQKLIEELNIENESMNRTVKQSDNEVLSMQQRVVSNGVIVEKLSHFIESMKNIYNDLNKKNTFFSGKADDQAKKFENLYSSFKSRINPLKIEFEEKYKLLNYNENKNLHDENLLLKKLIVQQREKLNQFDLLNKNMEVLLENNISLQTNQRKLEQLLSEKRVTVEDLETYLKSEENMSSITYLDNVLHEKKSILSLLYTKINDIEKDMSEIEEKHEDMEQVFNKKLLELSGIDEQTDKLVEKSKNLQCNLNSVSITYKDELNLARKPLDLLVDAISFHKKENEKLKFNIDFKLKEYTEKLEEKNRHVVIKCTFEEKIMAEKPLKANMDLLDKQIDLNKTKVDKCRAKIEELSKDDNVQDLTKNKAYLISSKEYLTEKLDNLKAQSCLLQTSFNIGDEKQLELEEHIKKKLEKIDGLKQKLLKNTKEGIIPGTGTPVSILKSTPCGKPYPISPKKVKFVGVSSNESGSLSGDVRLDNEPESMFDQLLEKFQKFKQSEKHIKNRKLDLE